MTDTAVPLQGLVRSPVIKVGGVVVEATLMDQLLDLRVDRTVNRTGSAELRFRDPYFLVIDAATFEIGKEVEVEFPSMTGDPTSVFKGEIVVIAADDGPSGGNELTLIAYDKSHRLGRTTGIKSSLNQTYVDVLSAMIGTLGLQSQVGTLDGIVYTYLMQATTDRAWLDALVTRSGGEWFVDDGKFIVRKRADGAASGPTVNYRKELRRFRVRYSAIDQLPSLEVHGWDPLSKAPLAATETATFSNPPGASTAPLRSGSTPKAHAFNGKLISAGNVVESADEATKLAASLAAQVAGNELAARGEVIGDPSIKPGTTLTVAGVGTKLSGAYYLTTVEHVYHAATGYLTRFTSEGPRSSDLVDLLGDGTGDLTEPASSFGQLGLTVGIVTNNNDPDYPGRVKVKLPMLTDEHESNWARVVSIGAGAARGLHISPEVNDEVLVGFEQGDLRRPYVLGGLWGGRDTVPESGFQADGKVVKTGITSRAGMKVLLDDSQESSRNIALIMPDGTTKLYLGADKVELWANDKPLQLKTGQASITMDQGKITLDAQNIVLKAQQKISIEATQDLEMKGLNVKATAQVNAEIKGAMAKLEGSGPTTVKGNPVQLN
jgi:phage protein D/phage baseplate assembly protein gpV